MKAWTVTIKKNNVHTYYYTENFTHLTWLLRMDVLGRLSVETYAINAIASERTICAEMLTQDVLDSLLKSAE